MRVGDQRLHRLRQRVAVPSAAARRGDELAHEERVAAGALGERRERVSRESATSRAAASASCVRRLAGERRELEQRRRARRRRRRALRPPRDDDEPRPAERRSRIEVREHEARGVVEPVRVLEDDQRRHQEHAHEELLDGVVELVARGTPASIALRLGRRLDRRVERDREQRQPRREVGHDGRDPRPAAARPPRSASAPA